MEIIIIIMKKRMCSLSSIQLFLFFFLFILSSMLFILGMRAKGTLSIEIKRNPKKREEEQGKKTQ